jgi:hypothetical protein
MIAAAAQMSPNGTRNGPKETPKTPLEFVLPIKTKYYVAFYSAMIPSSVYPTFASLNMCCQTERTLKYRGHPRDGGVDYSLD